jgi:serine/threonine protein kinase
MALLGEYLDKPTYTFLHTIGEGSIGLCSVYTHEVFGDRVVQKTITLLGVPDAIARSEPRLLQDARHDHIVQIREAQFDPEYAELLAVTFVTPYYAGGSVSKALLEGHSFSTRLALELVGGVLEALDFLHGRMRIIHRDVKPGNIMLSESRDYSYLGDLGSAAYMDDGGFVAAGGGTPLYEPPEAGSGVLDARADLYSAGMVLLELLNGRLPYETLNDVAIDRRRLNGQRSVPDRFFRLEPWVPRSVASFLRRLVALNPDDRFASAAEALRQLNRLSYVSWQRVRNDGFAGEWLGRWPSAARLERARQIHVELTSITSGRYAGAYRASAKHRLGVAAWRNYARLTRRIGEGDIVALAVFFREVEDAAQAVAIR